MFFSNDLPVNKFILVNGQRHLKSAKIILKYTLLNPLFSGLYMGLSHLCRGVHDGVVEAGHGAITLCLLAVAWAGCVIPPV